MCKELKIVPNTEYELCKILLIVLLLLVGKKKSSDTMPEPTYRMIRPPMAEV